MGLFDHQIQKLAEKLTSKLDFRAAELNAKIETEEDAGKRLLLKTTLVALQEVSNVITQALIDE